MTCANCGAECEIHEHIFYSGTRCTADRRQRVSEVWAIYAPLYYLASEDFRGAVLGFCGPICSSQWRLNREHAQIG